MQAIILAAGMGSRLKALTANNTKCMVEVNGVMLIDRMLAQLDSLGLDRIVLVVGYKRDLLIDHIRSLSLQTVVDFIENPIYDKTNNIYSLYLAKDVLVQQDTLLLESDLIFEDDILSCLVDDPRPTLALVDKYESWMDGTVVTLTEDDRIDAFIPGNSLQYGETNSYFKTVNVYKFSKIFSRDTYVPFLEAYTKALGNNEYYEQVLRIIAVLDETELRAKRLDGQLWYEIDDIQDLDIAESIFAPNDDAHLDLLQKRYGGYWRYPHLVDFCYLVNPFYPPQRMVNEMQASFDRLLRQYPSGLAVNDLLAAKYFGVSQDKVVVGNGAAELIKELWACLRDRRSAAMLTEDQQGSATSKMKVGFIRPTFEEYPNRWQDAIPVVWWPRDADFRYSASDLMGAFADENLDVLVLVNPDNPSGNMLTFDDAMNLVAWCRDRSITLVLDESFVDFADDTFTCLDDRLLEANPNLVVVKSISKSHGVPGARLGVLASADSDLIAAIRSAVSIWNINSIGEFYLQIAEKYHADFANALERFRMSRRNFERELNAIEGIRVLPSQANYFMLELTTDAISSRDLASKLLCSYDILIKDLTPKIGKVDGGGPCEKQYVRIAIRDDDDNKKLAQAIAEIMRQLL